jgi:hypothetical protein
MGILRGLFGPSKDEIWRQLSAEIGADFQESGFLRAGRIDLSHQQWTITLDTYVVMAGKTPLTFTRIRAPYVNRDGFRFCIYRKSVFSWLGRLFGVQDLQIGDSFFDDQFIIQGRQEMVRNLLLNAKIKQLIQSQPDIRFEVKDDEGWFRQTFPEGVDELYFETLGVIKDRERLRQLFELFALVLEEMCRLGSAYETDPGMKVD